MFPSMIALFPFSSGRVREGDAAPFAFQIVGNGGLYVISDSYIRMASAIPDAGAVGRGRQSPPRQPNSEGFLRIIGEQ